MKKLLLSLALLAAISLPARADVYYGTIEETVTFFNDPNSDALDLFHVGQKFTGYYEYTSPTIDGTFYGGEAPGVPPPGALETLSGQIYITLDLYPGEVDITHTHHYAYLTVSGGDVTSFDWYYEMGDDYAFAGETNMDEESYADYATSETDATLQFGKPRDLTNPVPETTPTIWALLFAACGLFSLSPSRRRV
jgi:hypothetical protein